MTQVSEKQKTHQQACTKCCQIPESDFVRHKNVQEVVPVVHQFHYGG